MIEEISSLPDVSFIDNKTLDDVQEEMIAAYEDKYRELTGKALKLRRADPEALKIYACSIQIYQMLLHIDRAGKMGLLKYSYGDFLDNLGARRGVSRLPAYPAKCVVKFTLSAQQESVVSIPAGTRVSNGADVYFATDDFTEIPIGETEADIPCTCLIAGEAGNNLMPGSLNVLVDRIAYVASVSNIDTTSGGADVESDEDFADRIYLAPSGYSVAGPVDAYRYHTQSFSPSIGDVEVSSPTPGDVVVRFLMTNGELPTDSFINEVKEHLENDQIRPLTDRVTVEKPSAQDFSINIKYFISKTKQDTAVNIQAAVNAAIKDYISWQTGAIGRDINPSVLIQMIVDAGAKRVEVTEPEFVVVKTGSVAKIGEQTITYGGVEDD